MASEKPVVFVSCGQYAENEKQLGKDICSLLAELCPEVTPYFAEGQSTAEGLSDHVLKALHRAAGFICVMHCRGDLKDPQGGRVTRGSVWVEQEIAIVAFMRHALNRSVPTLFYKQSGVSLEGIRSVLLLNPRIEFTEELQILQDLASALPSIDFMPFNAYDIKPIIEFRRQPGSGGDRHVYLLTCKVGNVGTQRITDFELRVHFPREFLEQSTRWGAEDRDRSTASHICFVGDAEQLGGLYPGDVTKNVLSIEYFVDSALYRNPSAMDSSIRVELFSGSMTPKRLTLPMRGYNNF